MTYDACYNITLFLHAFLPKKHQKPWIFLCYLLQGINTVVMRNHLYPVIVPEMLRSTRAHFIQGKTT